MRLIDIINESTVLVERHSYASMTDGLINAFAKFDIDIKKSWIVDRFKEEMKWSRSFLQREDRIVWYMRRVRMELIHSIYISEGMSALRLGGGFQEKTPLQIALTSLWESEQQRWEQTMGYPYDKTSFGRGHYSHFVAMENQIDAIRRYRWDRQSASILVRDLNAIEKRWKEEQEEKNRYLDNGDDETIISFPNSFQWVHLKRPSCSKEGKAMGHCGNAAAQEPGDTILSLRRKSDKPGLYFPVLTFILHRDGMLGEMKARFNEKPESKYHPYIIALLKNDMIKGIRGGGYRPRNNFSLDDLSDNDYEELIKAKPSLKEIK